MTYMTDIRRAGSHSGYGILDLATYPFKYVARAVKRYNDLALAEAQLNALSDHALNDIGLTRGEIHARVWQDHSRQ